MLSTEDLENFKTDIKAFINELWVNHDWISLSIIAIILNTNELPKLDGLTMPILLKEIEALLDRKAFYVLSALGFVVLLLKPILESYNSLVGHFHISKERLRDFYFCFVVIAAMAFIFDASLMVSFGLMWIIVLLSLFPLEWIFQSISRMRLKRNIIFMIYILICLLDSHIEGRIKIFSKLFK